MFYGNNMSYMLGSLAGWQLGNKIADGLFGNKGLNSYMSYGLFGMMTGIGGGLGYNYSGMLRAHLDSPTGSNLRWNSIIDDFRHFSMGGFSGGYDPTMGLRLNNGGINGSVFSKINDAVTTYNYNRNDYLSSFNGFNKLGSLSTLATNYNTSIGNGNFGWMQNGGLSGIWGTNFGNQTDNVDQKKYNAKMNLIKQYAADKDKTNEITKEVNELLNGINDPKVACEKLDEYMKTLDTDVLKNAAKKIGKNSFETKTKAGKAFSDKWVETMGSYAPGKSAKVKTDGLTKDNILDAIGTYISNAKFGEMGKANMWDVMIKDADNYNTISLKLYNKAEEMAEKYSDQKSTIEAAVNKLKNASDTEKATACYELFDCLRKIETETYAKEISETSGLPEDMATSIENPALENYNKEQKAWNDAPQMKTES